METAEQNTKQVMEENEALKQLIELLNQQDMYRDFMEALARVSPVPIRYEGMEGDRKGYFIDLNHPIAI